MKKLQKLSRIEMKNVLGGKFFPGCLPGNQMIICTTSVTSVCGDDNGQPKYCTTTTSGTKCWPTYDALPSGCQVAG